MPINVSVGEKCEWVPEFDLNVSDSRDEDVSSLLFSRRISKKKFLTRFAELKESCPKELVYILDHITDLESIHIHEKSDDNMEIWLIYKRLKDSYEYITVSKYSQVICFLLGL